MLAVWQFALSREICLFVLSFIKHFFSQNQKKLQKILCKYQIAFQITSHVIFGSHTSLKYEYKNGNPEFFAGNPPKANIQDGRHKCLIHI